MSKGPVLPQETGPSVDAALERLVSVARRLKLAAVVVQPPDNSTISPQALVRHGFFPRPICSVIRTTGMISLEGGEDAVLSRMSRTARQDWRTARRHDVTLSWGTRQDLGEFFRLMCASARRQGQLPNPSRPELLETLWDLLPARISLAFAEHEGRKRAGLLMIAERERLLFWKKGWDPETRRLFTSTFLMVECLLQASLTGFASVDMLSMSEDLAAAVLGHECLSAEQKRSRDVFNIRLGARPKALPPAHLLVVPPLLRRFAYAGLRHPFLWNTVERRM